MKILPYRGDCLVETWRERDRLSIVVTDERTGNDVAEWWDKDVEQLTEDGYFNWRNIEDSVLDYCEELKLIQPGYNPDDEEDEYDDDEDRVSGFDDDDDDED